MHIEMVIVLDFSPFIHITETVTSDHPPAKHLPKSCTPSITAGNTITEPHISLPDRTWNYLVSLKSGWGEIFCLFSFPSELKASITDGVTKCNFPPVSILLNHLRNEASDTHRTVTMWETKGLFSKDAPWFCLFMLYKSTEGFFTLVHIY